jgi:hypothetical protein
MIVRAWRGYAAMAETQAYPRHLLQSVRPKLEQLVGFRGLYLLRRRGLEDAVRAFAGDQPELAVVEPEARAALLRFDDRVSHYEVLATPDVAG